MRLTASDVVLVSGGASGLGAATVASVLAAGAQAIVLDLPAARVTGSSKANRSDSSAATYATRPTSYGRSRRRTDLGTLRAAVNCAGVATPGRVIGKRGVLPLADFRRVIEINLVGTFNVLRLAAEAMVGNEPADGDRGVIVMTASVAAYDGQIGQAAYAASKGGIAALTLSAARDLADKAIRVMTIAPGVMETPMMSGLPGETKTILEALVPHPPRLGRPEEYAALVQHILANPLLNGEVIRLDGALRMPPR